MTSTLSRYQSLFLITLLWGGLVVLSLSLRPLLPMDETRYLSVAWEMWNSGDFLVPHLNGQPYSHKPPLLFWIMQAGWAILGVNDWWPRLVAPLFGLGCLLMTRSIALRLWPDAPEVASVTPLILLGALFWTIFSSLTMFDMLVASVTVAAMLCLLRARDTGSVLSFMLLGMVIGIGALAKGPVTLLYVLPVALLAPVWDVGGIIRTRTGGWRNWYIGVAIAVVIGIVIGLAWAIPAAVLGGEEYRNAILWGQTAGRVVNSFAHKQPTWWYAVILPVTLLPWMIWPPLWRSFMRAWNERNSSSFADGSVLFCVCWIIPALLALSAVSGKQPHYLLPILPAITLLFAKVLIIKSTPSKRLDQAPILALVLVAAVAVTIFTAKEMPVYWNVFSLLWILPVLIGSYLYTQAKDTVLSITLVSILLIISIQGLGKPLVGSAFDLSEMASRIKSIQQQGKPVVHVGKYHGQYHFLGKLTQTIDVVGCRGVEEWLTKNPTGAFIKYQRIPFEGSGLLYTQPYRGKYVALWDGVVIVTSNDAVLCKE